jgi:hypothetical protein
MCSRTKKKRRKRHERFDGRLMGRGLEAGEGRLMLGFGEDGQGWSMNSWASSLFS